MAVFFGVDRRDLIGRDYHYVAVELSERIKMLFLCDTEKLSNQLFLKTKDIVVRLWLLCTSIFVTEGW